MYELIHQFIADFQFRQYMKGLIIEVMTQIAGIFQLIHTD